MSSEPVGVATPDLSSRGGQPAPGAERSSRRLDLSCLAVLGLVWLAMVALVNPIGDFPLNDDWVYGLAVKSILERGDFILPSANANLVAQAYWGALFCLPFGFSFTALRISTLVLGLVGIVATFGTARELGAGTRTAGFAAALVAGNPLYFALANTFMTDVPFFAVSAASLYFLVRWTTRHSPRDALLGLALSMIVILVRQAGIVMPIGFAVAYVVKQGMRPRTIAIAALPVAAGVALHFGFQAWLHTTGRTPLAGEPPLMAMIADNLRYVYRIPLRLSTFCAYVGLFLLPLLAVASSWMARRSDTAQRRRLLAIFGAAVVVSVVAATTIGRAMPFIDNVMNAFGTGPLTLNDTFFFNANFPYVPPWLIALWLAATLGAFVGTGMLACVVVCAIRAARDRRWQSESAQALIVLGCSGIAYALLAALALKFFYDRYILFLLLPGVLLVAWLVSMEPDAGPSRRGSALLIVALVVQAIYTVVATRDYLEWNRLRWGATSALMAEGIPPTSSVLNITVSFLGHKWFVFKTRGNYLKEWVRCLMVYSGAIALGLVLLPPTVFGVTYLTGNARTAPYIAGALLLGLQVIWSFLGHKRFSFRADGGTQGGA